ncbi:IS701 family transposase [Pontibacter sp. CAU 1760]
MESSHYIAYLLSEPRKVSCVKASEVLEVSHDEINRFLLSSHFTGKELFEAVKQGLCLEGGVLSVDDSVLDKPFTDPATTELVGYFYSGRHHRVVKGISLITLFYTDTCGVGLPVNFRIYRHREGKTKHDYFQQMVKECWQWGLRPKWVSADSWYASVENLKFLRNQEVGFLVGLEANRIVSTTPGRYEQVGRIEDVPQEGLFTHLKGFGFVKVFRTVDTEGHARHYAMYLPDEQPCRQISREQFKEVKARHWQVEECFRTIKQECHAQHFFVRQTQAIQNHLFCVLRAFQRLVWMSQDSIIENVYALQRKLLLQVQREFILNYA